MRIWITLLALSLSLSAQAKLNALDESALANTTGQAASVSLGLDLRYNLDEGSNGNVTNICSSGRIVACNLGVSFNNRYLTNAAGNRVKAWLVMKNATGAITIPEIRLSGDIIQVGGKDKAVLNMFISELNPITIRKLGFESLAIETDTDLEINSNGTINTNNLPGYRKGAVAAGATTFDQDKARGFLGLDVTAKVAVNGNFKVFSCSSDRC